MTRAPRHAQDPITDDAVDTTSLLSTIATIIALTLCLAAFALNDSSFGVMMGTAALFCLASSLICFRTRRRAMAERRNLLPRSPSLRTR